MAFTSADSMMTAIGIFFGCLFAGLFLALVGGLTLDVWYEAMRAAGWFSLPAEYETNLLPFLMGLFYTGCVCIPLYGLYILILTIYHQYIVEGEEETDYTVSSYLGGKV